MPDLDELDLDALLDRIPGPDAAETLFDVDPEVYEELQDRWLDRPRRVRNALEKLGYAPFDAWEHMPEQALDPDAPPTFETIPGATGRNDATIVAPQSIEQLAAYLAEARRKDRAVKPVSPARNHRGHSFSEISTPEEFQISLDALKGTASPNGFGLDTTTLRTGEPDRLQSFLGGSRIRDVNAWLDDNELALENMGAYDGQSITGAISTDTHGSGIWNDPGAKDRRMGPFSTLVRSMIFVTEDGEICRIEPEDGITDPAAHADGDAEARLVQNDRIFNSTVVGLGCMGVMASVTLEASPHYYLRETRRTTEWEDLADSLRDGAPFEHRHFNVAINPYEYSDERRALVTTRDKLERRPANYTHDQRHRSFAFRVAAALPVGRNVARNRLLGSLPTRASTIHRSLAIPEDDEYVSDWDNVLLLGLDNLKFESMEVGIPITEQGDWVDHVEKVVEMLDPWASGSGFKPTAPISLRFVGPSDAYISPQYGRPATCMIEVPFLQKQRYKTGEGVDEMLREIHDELLGRGGRPHWAKINFMDWNRYEHAYPTEARDKWFETYSEFNDSGIFDNDFTDQLGISQSTQ